MNECMAMPQEHIDVEDEELQRNVDPRCKETEFWVEADSYARFQLWREWHRLSPGELQSDRYPSSQSNRLDWQEESSGIIYQAGELDGRPVMVELFWAIINGHRIGFYHATSQVVDWKMVEEFINKLKYPLWDNGTRHAHTNATNFHHVAHFVQGC